MGFEAIRLDDRVSCVQETGVANFMRCNIWHVRGRDCDLVIDTGMGLSPLKTWIAEQTDRPVKAIITHSHFDHSGGLHEFDTRLGHRAEAELIAQGGRDAVLYGGDWTEIGIVDPARHPGFDSAAYTVRPAPLTGYLDEGDVVDLGDVAYQVLHLPGHSPGSIGLYDRKAGTVFCGDALYDGALLDNLHHSHIPTYRATLRRIAALNAQVFHAGHYPSFGARAAQQMIDAYLAGQNALGDVTDWYHACCATGEDIFAPQDWSRCHDL